MLRFSCSSFASSFISCSFVRVYIPPATSTTAAVAEFVALVPLLLLLLRGFELLLLKALLRGEAVAERWFRSCCRRPSWLRLLYRRASSSELPLLLRRVRVPVAVVSRRLPPPLSPRAFCRAAARANEEAGDLPLPASVFVAAATAGMRTTTMPLRDRTSITSPHPNAVSTRAPTPLPLALALPLLLVPVVVVSSLLVLLLPEYRAALRLLPKLEATLAEDEVAEE